MDARTRRLERLVRISQNIADQDSPPSAFMGEGRERVRRRPAKEAKRHRDESGWEIEARINIEALPPGEARRARLKRIAKEIEADRGVNHPPGRHRRPRGFGRDR